MPMMTNARQYGSELVLDLLDAANCFDKLRPTEIQELLRDAATVLCELTNPCCPSEASKAGCARPYASVQTSEEGDASIVGVLPEIAALIEQVRQKPAAENANTDSGPWEVERGTSRRGPRFPTRYCHHRR
jgi:hypothetical protein